MQLLPLGCSGTQRVPEGHHGVTSRAFNGPPRPGSHWELSPFHCPKDPFLGNPTPREKQEWRQLLAQSAQTARGGDAQPQITLNLHFWGPLMLRMGTWGARAPGTPHVLGEKASRGGLVAHRGAGPRGEVPRWQAGAETSPPTSARDLSSCFRKKPKPGDVGGEEPALGWRWPGDGSHGELGREGEIRLRGQK